MSAPCARLVHSTGARTRLRVPSQRARLGFFDEVRSQLSETKGVRAVETNALTASILIEHDDGRLGEVLEVAERRGLFVVPQSRADGTALKAVRERIASVDAELSERTQGEWDLSGIGFYALLGAGIVQCIRGQVLPAGLALVLTATSMLKPRSEAPPVVPAAGED